MYKVRKGGRSYALKIYRKGFAPNDSVSSLLKQGECPALARLLTNGFYRGDYYYEVFPLYSAGTLDDLISAGECTPRFIEHTLLPSLDNALHYLHAHGLVHADVKPGNIFVSADRRSVVLGDFGVAGTTANSGGLVPFRGTLEYAPYALHQGNQVRIDAAYDYGSLGLVLIKAFTGYSPFAGMTLEERDRAVISLRVPQSIPARPRALIEGLLNSDPRLRFGHVDVQRYCSQSLGGTRVTPVARITRTKAAGTGAKMRARLLEFGFYEGHMIMVSTAAELLQAAEAHWDGARIVVDDSHLKPFLKAIGAGDVYARFVEPFNHRPIDKRAFLFCCALRLFTQGSDARAIVYKGEKFSDVRELVRAIAQGREDLADFLDDDVLVFYLRQFGFGDDAAKAADDVLQSDKSEVEKAQLLLSMLEARVHGLYVDGVALNTPEDLMKALMGMDGAQLAALAADQELENWLYRHHCDFAYSEMEAADEQ